MTFVGVIFGQIGTAFEVRTRRASLRSVGVFSNRYLLWVIAGELAIAAVFVFAPRVKRCSAPPSHPHATCCCSSVSIHRLGRRRTPQVGDPGPVLAARAGRHTSTRRLTFGRTSNEYGSRTAPSDSVAGTGWRLQQWPACCEVRGNQRHRRSAVLLTRVRR
jgi:Cation transporting ATPase, C-terminus